MRFHLLRLSANPSLPECFPLASKLRPCVVVGRRDELNPAFNERVLSLELRSSLDEAVACISRRHARIVVRGVGDDAVVKVFDDSLTGVYVNDRKIDHEARLEEGRLLM